MSAFNYFRTVPVKEWILLDILKLYDDKFNDVTLNALCNRIKQDLNGKDIFKTRSKMDKSHHCDQGTSTSKF